MLQSNTSPTILSRWSRHQGDSIGSTLQVFCSTVGNKAQTYWTYNVASIQTWIIVYLWHICQKTCQTILVRWRRTPTQSIGNMAGFKNVKVGMSTNSSEEVQVGIPSRRGSNRMCGCGNREWGGVGPKRVKKPITKHQTSITNHLGKIHGLFFDNSSKQTSDPTRV